MLGRIGKNYNSRHSKEAPHSRDPRTDGCVSGESAGALLALLEPSVPLGDRLRDRIAREGPISFADFMRAALYDPEAGYYARGAPIGEPGDFVTSPHVSPAFAATLARIFAFEAEALAGPVDFVEAGAGDGRFLEDFTQALQALAPEVSARLRVTAVEASAAGRGALALRPIVPEPRILASVDELTEGSVSGWIFSNELFDALPVARVMGSEEGLRELRVRFENGRFVWASTPAGEPLSRDLETQGIVLSPGQKGEVSLELANVQRRLASSLARGWLVAFDYGHPARILYHPLARPEGTLAVHARGRRGGDPLEDPGAQDLTAHVNWDVLLGAGEAEGLHTDRLARQGSYLVEAGIFDFARNDAEKWRIFRLVDPEGMGEEISVLVQSRGVTAGVTTL
jgi:SAM-dependent MidA family methyltransferase